MNQSEDRQRRAIVIENDLVVAWWIEEILRYERFSETVIAPSFEAASQAIARESFDLVVLDVKLGPYSPDGITAMRRLDPEGQMPTIVHSAVTRDEALAAGKAPRGEVAWLVKPCGEDEFVRTVRDVRHTLDAAETQPEMHA